MPRSPKDEPIEIDEFLLRPYFRLTKLMITGILTAVSVIVLILMGYRGRTHKPAPVPNVIVELSDYAVPILIAVLILSVVGIFWINLKSDYTHQRIIFNANVIHFYTEDQIITMNLSKLRDISYVTMPGFEKLFWNEFHRVGRLSFSIGTHRHVLYIPVRNGYIVDQLESLAEESRKTPS